jgi:hypothetical protein
MKNTSVFTQKDVDNYNNGRIEAYWNGVEVEAQKVNIIVADDTRFPMYWARELVGTQRKALKITVTKAPKNADGDIVEVNPPEIFYIDNEDGEGLKKVTEGKGMWTYSHKSLNAEKEV